MAVVLDSRSELVIHEPLNDVESFGSVDIPVLRSRICMGTLSLDQQLLGIYGRDWFVRSALIYEKRHSFNDQEVIRIVDGMDKMRSSLRGKGVEICLDQMLYL